MIYMFTIPTIPTVTKKNIFGANFTGAAIDSTTVYTLPVTPVFTMELTAYGA
jgi:hypothetical protein